jgi:hypothetical protein
MSDEIRSFGNVTTNAHEDAKIIIEPAPHLLSPAALRAVIDGERLLPLDRQNPWLIDAAHTALTAIAAITALTLEEWEQRAKDADSAAWVWQDRVDRLRRADSEDRAELLAWGENVEERIHRDEQRAIRLRAYAAALRTLAALAQQLQEGE